MAFKPQYTPLPQQGRLCAPSLPTIASQVSAPSMGLGSRELRDLASRAGLSTFRSRPYGSGVSHPHAQTRLFLGTPTSTVAPTHELSQPPRVRGPVSGLQMKEGVRAAREETWSHGTGWGSQDLLRQRS